ncbi:hypothetical protein L1887_32227 [Cichorium endivia]|nr:hypothetical protein L1887_32227 [Cichorium endivia]
MTHLLPLSIDRRSLPLSLSISKCIKLGRGKEAPLISLAIDEESPVAAATLVAPVGFGDDGSAGRLLRRWWRQWAAATLLLCSLIAGLLI